LARFDPKHTAMDPGCIKETPSTHHIIAAAHVDHKRDRGDAGIHKQPLVWTHCRVCGRAAGQWGSGVAGQK
jgi:hypothetical protein